MGAIECPQRISPGIRHTFVSRILLILCLAVFPAAAATTDISKLLKGIEDRYNRARTLQIHFAQTYTYAQGRRMETGDLYLRKPGKMRWVYSNPAGKVFVSDAKDAWFYSPAANRVEKMKLKETDDMRAPMAFLLGRLDFSRDFKEFRSRPEGEAVFITAIPKSEKMPYREVSFLVSPAHQIQRLIVTGQDGSVLQFDFSAEKVNPPLEDSLFGFQIPRGAELVDLTNSQAN